MINKTLIALLLLIPITALAKKEKDHQIPWCEAAGGKWEQTLPDRTRVDCITATHAIEFDWAEKWSQAIGQSLYYAFQTNKRAGIVLIFKKETDYICYQRMMSVIQHNNMPIDVWTTGKDAKVKK